MLVWKILGWIQVPTDVFECIYQYLYCTLWYNIKKIIITLTDWKRNQGGKKCTQVTLINQTVFISTGVPDFNGACPIVGARLFKDMKKQSLAINNNFDMWIIYVILPFYFLTCNCFSPLRSHFMIYFNHFCPWLRYKNYHLREITISILILWCRF